MRAIGRMEWVGSLVLVVALPSAGLFAGDGANAVPEWIDPTGIRGSLVLVGGGGMPSAIRDKIVELAGGKDGRLVIIPTAREEDEIVDDADDLMAPWKSRGLVDISFLHTRDQAKANDPKFVEPLKKATGVWITGGKQGWLARSYTGTLVEKELHAVLERGGVVAGTSAGAACMSRDMIIFGKIWEIPGFGLIPGTIVDQHFLTRNRLSRLQALLEVQPAKIGIGVDENTALVLQGRTMRCIGDSTVTVCLGKTNGCDCQEIVLKPGDVSDFTMWRRAGLARLQAAFPPAKMSEPKVENGSLVIVGGGGLPKEVVEKFIELAGGPESLIVVLPIANGARSPGERRAGAFLEKAGAKNVKVLSARTRAEVESPEFLETVKQAKGVWFGGGRQWRFVDAYDGTKAVEAFRDVLRRGGVIGGSSAGATIQGDYLCRGSPLGNEEMMAPGYERGFGFLPGTAIDQHFSQRKRFGDMTKLVAAHPQLLGIGIDESTALVVQGSTAEVVGKNEVHFYDRRRAVKEGEPDHASVGTGGKFDLRERNSVEGE